jgi:hypothetical protein
VKGAGSNSIEILTTDVAGYPSSLKSFPAHSELVADEDGV